MQVQQRAATLLLSVDASPLPDAACIRATAKALAQLLRALGESSCKAPVMTLQVTSACLPYMRLSVALHKVTGTLVSDVSSYVEHG